VSHYRAGVGKGSIFVEFALRVRDRDASCEVNDSNIRISSYVETASVY